LEAELLAWAVPLWEAGVEITTTMLQGRASMIAKDKKITEFRSSSSWVAGFKARHGIVFSPLHGEKASADVKAAKDYPPVFRAMVASLGVTEEYMFNADESLLYTKLRRQGTLCPAALVRDLRAGKKSKCRIGMTVTTCADGTNEVPMLFSGTAKLPRHMVQQGDKKVVDDVRGSPDGTHLYYPSQKGWISRGAIKHYLTRVLPEHIRRKQQEKGVSGPALLIVDGCGIHFTALLSIYAAIGDGPVDDGPVAMDCCRYTPDSRDDSRAAERTPQQARAMKAIREHGADLKFDNFTLHIRVLPPNTTSLLQPADQGLIAQIKSRWRTELDSRVCRAGTAAEAKAALKEIPVMDVMGFVANALRSVGFSSTVAYWKALKDETYEPYGEVLERKLADVRATAEKMLLTQAGTH
jgi:hypothetical protein